MLSKFLFDIQIDSYVSIVDRNIVLELKACGHRYIKCQKLITYGACLEDLVEKKTCNIKTC